MAYRNRGDPPEIEGMTSLKIDNISTRTGPNELRRAFDRFGEIGDIHIPRDRYTGDNKGFAFVRFYSRRDAEYAMEKMDGERVDGRLVRVVMARYSRPCDERKRRDDDDGRRRGRSRSRSRSRDRHARRRRSRSASDGGSKRKKHSASKSRSRSPTTNKNGRRASRSAS